MPVVDVVAVAVPPSTFLGPGTLVIDRSSGPSAFALAAINVGAADSVTVHADTGGTSLPLSFTTWRTDLTTASCLAPPAASVTTSLAHDESAGFAVFVTSTGRIPFNPGGSRIVVRFQDGTGAVRGATSLAVLSN
jgi:hypothetical protein